MSSSSWTPPKTLQEVYVSLAGGTLTINQDSAGARTEKDLPKGSREYQLYSLNTPNGQKVGIALEEFGVEYDAHVINILKGDQFTSGFVDVNPNSKIPALLVKGGGAGEEDIKIFESGAILIYLAERYGRFYPPASEPKLRTECNSWLMWQMASQGPMFGQFNHFYRYAPRDKHEAINYGVARYGMELKRLLSVMDQHLADGRTWFLGAEYSIADMILFPWTFSLIKYDLNEFLQLDIYPNVLAWVKRTEARPAVQRGLNVCALE